MDRFVTTIGRITPTIFLALAVASCASVPVEEQSEELRLLLGEIQAREQVLDKRQALLKKRAELLATIEIQQEQAMPLEPMPNAAAGSNYLAAPKEGGQCHRLVHLPAKLSAEPLEVVVQDAADQIVLSPAIFSTVPRSVVVGYKLGEAAGEVEMRTRQERFTIKPSYIDFEVEPAQFDARPQEILSMAAHQQFLPCDGAAAKLIDGNQKWCAETVPAQYQTVEHRRLLALSRVAEVTRPAETVTLTINEPVNPVDTALYEPIVEVLEQQQLVTPASFKREVLLPEFQTVTVKRLLRPAALSWVAVVCNAKNEARLLEQVQQVLAGQGYAIGEADGEWGENTDAALAKYRAENDLPQIGRDLSLEELMLLELDLGS